LAGDFVGKKKKSESNSPVMRARDKMQGELNPNQKKIEMRIWGGILTGRASGATAKKDLKLEDLVLPDITIDKQNPRERQGETPRSKEEKGQIQLRSINEEKNSRTP